MRYKYKVKFRANAGYRFFRDDVSLLVEALGYGRRLSDADAAKFVLAMDGYLRPDLDRQPSRPIGPDDFPDVSDEPLYKYVSQSTWKRIFAEGSFRFGSAEDYRTIENQNARDEREGTTAFHLVHGDDQLTVSLVGGYNCRVFCATADLQGTEHELMLEKFGPRRIRINPARDFIAIAKEHLNAHAARTFDVLYADQKHYSLQYPGIRKFVKITGSGGSTTLNGTKLKRLDEAFFDIFYGASFMPSLFAKPTSFSDERERRVVFETVHDLRKPAVIVRDRSFLDVVHPADCLL